MPQRTVAVVFAGFCAFLALFAPQPMLPMLAAAFHVSAARISLVVTASTLAVAVSAPLAGFVADRFGRKRVIVPAAFLLAVPPLLAATSMSFAQLLFWRFLQGVFTPGIFAVIIAYINEEWDSGAGAATAAYVTGTVIGGFSGRFLAELAVELRGDGCVERGGRAGDSRVASGRPAIRGRAACGIAGSADAAPLAQSPAGGDVCGRVLRDVQLAGHVHVHQFLPGRAAVPAEHDGAGVDLRGVPGGRGDYAGGGARDRPHGPSLCAGGGVQCGRHGRADHVGTQPPPGDGRPDAGLHRRIHRELRGVELCGQCRHGIAGVGGGALCDVLLHGRQRGVGRPGRGMHTRWVAGVRGGDCGGAATYDHVGADILEAAAHGVPRVDGRDRGRVTMLVLASQSPRRAEILRQAGIPFVVRGAPVDESALEAERPGPYVRRLAHAKAEAVEAAAGEIVLAADTTVVAHGDLLAKPADADDARRMLGLLSGRRHEVLT